MLCGKPQRPAQNYSTSSLTCRLTDVSKYGGTHRQRFDSSGNGLGVAGRRDLVAKNPLGLFSRPHDDSIFAISTIIK